MLKSALGYAAMEKQVDALSDSDFMSVVQKEVKKQQGRGRGADSTQAGAGNWRRRKRPSARCWSRSCRSRSPPRIEALVKGVIAELGAASKEMGPVIKAVQARAAGRADGRTISTLVGQLLPA